MVKMAGLSMASLKKNPALLPLYVCIGAGGCAALFYTIRLASRNPDVSWTNKKESEPWNEYKDKRYKFLSPVEEHKNRKSQAPEY